MGRISNIDKQPVEAFNPVQKPDLAFWFDRETPEDAYWYKVVKNHGLNLTMIVSGNFEQFLKKAKDGYHIYPFNIPTTVMMNDYSHLYTDREFYYSASDSKTVNIIGNKSDFDDSMRLANFDQYIPRR